MITNMVGVASLFAGISSASAQEAPTRAIQAAETPREFTPAEVATRKQHIQECLDELARGGSKGEDIWVSALQEMHLSPAEGIPIFVGLLDSTSDSVAARAMRVLGEDYGPKAKVAIPKVLELLDQINRQDGVPVMAAFALGRIGPLSPAVIPALVKRLEMTSSSSINLKLKLIEALEAIRPPSEMAVPALRRQLTDSHTSVRYAAFRALGRIEQGEKPASVELQQIGDLNRLSDEKLAAVLLAIAETGPDAWPTVPALLGLQQKNSKNYVRCATIAALGAAGSSDPRAIQVLLDNLAAEDEFISSLAGEALNKIDPRQTRSVTVLTRALNLANPKVFLPAALALKKFGPAGAPGATAVAALLKKCDEQVPEKQIGVYLETLMAMGKGAKAAGEILVNMLPENAAVYKGRTEPAAHYLRAFILATLAEVGVPKSALPFILDGLANSDGRAAHLYSAAARAAGALGPAAQETVPFLLRALKQEFRDDFLTFESYQAHRNTSNDYTTCRVEAVRALAKIGPPAKAAIPLLNNLAAQNLIPLDGPGRMFRVPNLADEARKAIKAIQG